MRLRFFIVLILIFGVTRSAQAHLIIMEGDWGGDQILMNVTDKGATLQIGCVRGVIDSYIRVDLENRFNVEGSYMPGGVGSDGTPVTRSAIFSGFVNGDNFELTIERSDTHEKFGPYRLEYNIVPVMPDCPAPAP